MIHRVELSILYGSQLEEYLTIDQQSVYENVDKQRIALTYNAIIEHELGKYEIICIEDKLFFGLNKKLIFVLRRYRLLIVFSILH